MGEKKLILLDTDIIIEVLDKNSDKCQEFMLKIVKNGSEYCTSSVNMHELLYGIEKYSKDSRLVLQIPTLEYGKKDSELSALLKLSTEKRKVSSKNGCHYCVNSHNNGCSFIR